MSSASQTRQGVPKSTWTNSRSDSYVPKQRIKLITMYVAQQFLLEVPPNNICPVSFRLWAFNLFMAKGRSRYCGLVSGPRVQKYSRCLPTAWSVMNYFYIIYKYNHVRPEGRGLETRDLYFYLWGQLRPHNVFSSNWKRTDSSPTQFDASQTIPNGPWTFQSVRQSIIRGIIASIDYSGGGYLRHLLWFVTW